MYMSVYLCMKALIYAVKWIIRHSDVYVKTYMFYLVFHIHCAIHSMFCLHELNALPTLELHGQNFKAPRVIESQQSYSHGGPSI